MSFVNIVLFWLMLELQGLEGVRLQRVTRLILHEMSMFKGSFRWGVQKRHVYRRAVQGQQGGSLGPYTRYVWLM